MKVTTGRTVHYMPRGDETDILPEGVHCAAIVRSVPNQSAGVVHLKVFHPETGEVDAFDVPPGQEGTRAFGQPGTWHWCEREE